MKLKLRNVLLAVAACWTTGCDSTGGKPGRRHGPGDSAAESSVELRPDLFTAAPETVEGCVGLYTYDSLNIAFDSLDVDKGRKLLATKAQSFAFLRLHGKSLVLRYDSAESAQLGNKEFREVYRGDEYKLVLTLRTLREEGEAVQETGTLEIIHGGRHYTVKVKGLSGC